MPSPRGRHRLLALVGFLLAACTLLVVGGPLRAPASSAARAIVSPFVALVRGATTPIGDAVDGIFNYGNVLAQNHRLREELAALQLRAEEQGFATTQLHSVSALDRLPFVGQLPTVTAATTAENLSDFSSTIEIDKGTAAGVLTGMPVVGGGGLVGIVTSATRGGATVTLLTDPSSSIAVTFGRGGEAVLRGQGNGNDLAADFVPPNAPVRDGETFYTSGLRGGLYPAGIPVGTVTGSVARRGETQLEVTLAPLADLDGLSYVDVVLWEPGT